VPNCDPSALSKAASCFRGLSERALQEIIASRYCQRAYGMSGSLVFTGTATNDTGNRTSATSYTGFSGLTVSAGATGTFAGADGALLTGYPFTFVPMDPDVSPLWTMTFNAVNFEFDASALSLDFHSHTLISISSAGTARAAGFADTPFTMDLEDALAGLTVTLTLA
jgi:hypothetical protein